MYIYIDMYIYIYYDILRVYIYLSLSPFFEFPTDAW